MLLFGGGGATHKYTSGFSRGVMRAHHGWNDPLRVVWARAIYAARPVRVCVCIYIDLYDYGGSEDRARIQSGRVGIG